MREVKIWKMQRPIVSTDKLTEIMVYTEGRENMMIIPMDESMMKDFFGDKWKVYVKASYDGETFEIDEYVSDRDW